MRADDGHIRASVPGDAMPAGVFKGVQDDWLGRGREDRQAGGPQAITTTEVILPLISSQNHCTRSPGGAR